MGNLPPNPDAAKDREKWRNITPPDRKKKAPEQSRMPEATATQSPQAHGESLPSSGDTSRPLQASTETAEAGDEEAGATRVFQRTPSRGIWEWARAGTGRLNIIGRIPHPEWRGPTMVRKADMQENGIQETHDDFSIPSTMATAPGNVTRKQEAAKFEGPGIESIISPSFAQTKRSSDELVANASSIGTPGSRVLVGEPWTDADNVTPSATSKESPPSTPDTPTPQQRKMEPLEVRRGFEQRNSPTPQRHHDGEQFESDHATTPKKSTPTPTSTATNCAQSTTESAKSKSIHIPSPNHVPKYKVALASSLLSPARNSVST